MALSLESSISFRRHSWRQKEIHDGGEPRICSHPSTNCLVLEGSAAVSSWTSSHLLEVFDGLEVESLLVQQLQVLVVQLISPHLVLLLLPLHLGSRVDLSMCRSERKAPFWRREGPSLLRSEGLQDPEPALTTPGLKLAPPTPTGADLLLKVKVLPDPHLDAVLLDALHDLLHLPQELLPGC